MKKFKIIDKIEQCHPAYGVHLGLSEYTGGMKDTGRWYTGRLLPLRKSELKRLLKDFTKAPVAPEPREEGDEVVLLSNGMWYYKEEYEARKRFEEGIERFWHTHYDIL